MTDSRAALGPDRLPWLNEEAASPPASRRSWRFPWLSVIGCLTIVAAGSYWIGQRSVNFVEPEAQAPIPAGPTADEIQTAPPPEVRPAPQPEAPSPTPPLVKEPAQAPPASAQSSPRDASSRQLWSAWDSAGAHGRMIRVGAYSSIHDAKLGWRRMVEARPALAGLPATVVGVTNSREVHYFRLQIGTSSQAHSEVLCQRVQKIDLSCAVIGLPVKPEGVER
ncbi:MAG TPA: hypothetical protein VFK19_03295 [Sphingomicrobium sp.]|nr:hypothetical protein [Sphingomicrobium sp.]